MARETKITFVLVGIAALASKLAGGSFIGPALAAAFVGLVVGGPVFDLYKWARRITARYIRMEYWTTLSKAREQRSSTG